MYVPFLAESLQFRRLHFQDSSAKSCEEQQKQSPTTLHLEGIIYFFDALFLGLLNGGMKRRPPQSRESYIAVFKAIKTSNKCGPALGERGYTVSMVLRALAHMDKSVNVTNSNTHYNNKTCGIHGGD